ncbi:MAG: ATP-binding protein [Granulosicoccus sp.]
MRDQVEHVLHYSRTTERGGATEPISLKLLIEEILIDLKGDIELSGASISYGDLPVISGNRMQVRALFQNLIGNAMKFCVKERGPVVAITSTFNESTGQHCIEVKDNGIGIAPENQASIFQLFTRLHLYEDYAGTGIGLALCYRVMKNHHGGISVSSNGCDGSIFTLNFPYLKS